MMTREEIQSDVKEEIKSDVKEEIKSDTGEQIKSDTGKETQSDTEIDSVDMLNSDKSILQYMVKPDAWVELEEPPQVSKPTPVLIFLEKLGSHLKSIFALN